MSEEAAYSPEELEEVRKINSTLPDWLQIDETRCLRPYPEDYEWWKERSVRLGKTE